MFKNNSRIQHGDTQKYDSLALNRLTLRMGIFVIHFIEQHQQKVDKFPDQKKVFSLHLFLYYITGDVIIRDFVMIDPHFDQISQGQGETKMVHRQILIVL